VSPLVSLFSFSVLTWNNTFFFFIFLYQQFPFVRTRKTPVTHPVFSSFFSFNTRKKFQPFDRNEITIINVALLLFGRLGAVHRRLSQSHRQSADRRWGAAQQPGGRGAVIIDSFSRKKRKESKAQVVVRFVDEK
jgi:hypothetical protein